MGVKLDVICINNEVITSITIILPVTTKIKTKTLYKSENLIVFVHKTVTAILINV